MPSDLDLAPIVFGLAILVALLAIVAVVLVRRVGRLERRLAGLTRGEDGRSLESILELNLGKVHQVGREVDTLAARIAILEGRLPGALQHVGIVRFNPFEDTGGNQSFALSLLDDRGDGLVVSSLHARSGSRIYAKPISDGRAEAALSGEETEAVRQALAGRDVRSAAVSERA